MPGAVKTVALAMGTTAVIAMGALTVAVSEPTVAPDMLSTSSEATLGETTTETTAPTAMPTPFATPPITSTEEAG
jgi:hypothetical protein